jgi:hypothetical protein
MVLLIRPHVIPVFGLHRSRSSVNLRFHLIHFKESKQQNASEYQDRSFVFTMTNLFKGFVHVCAIFSILFLSPAVAITHPASAAAVMEQQRALARQLNDVDVNIVMPCAQPTYDLMTCAATDYPSDFTFFTNCLECALDALGFDTEADGVGIFYKDSDAKCGEVEGQLCAAVPSCKETCGTCYDEVISYANCFWGYCECGDLTGKPCESGDACCFDLRCDGEGGRGSESQSFWSKCDEEIKYYFNCYFGEMTEAERSKCEACWLSQTPTDIQGTCADAASLKTEFCNELKLCEADCQKCNPYMITVSWLDGPKERNIAEP